MGEPAGEDIVGNGHIFVEEIADDSRDGNCLNALSTSDEGDAFGNSRPSNGSVVARMPTERHATHYNMSHRYRGMALIFNHEHFRIPHLKSRTGTSQDCKNLEATLKAYGFEVRVFQDRKADEVQYHIDQASKANHTDNDCVLICVLSHGENGLIYANDMAYKPDDLWTCFTADRCPTLAGKPKIYLLQACQGDKLDGGVILSRTETDGKLITSYRIPSHADFLIVYSTVKGYYSWRNTTKGSWFIQAFCDVLNQEHDCDFVTLLTFVAQQVAFDFESNTPDTAAMHQQKQIPCIMSMLTRLIKFTRK